MENKDIFIKDLKEAIGEDNIKLLIKYINNQIKRGIKEKTEAKKIN